LSPSIRAGLAPVPEALDHEGTAGFWQENVDRSDFTDPRERGRWGHPNVVGADMQPKWQTSLGGLAMNSVEC
jgi:hypothetical protein